MPGIGELVKGLPGDLDGAAANGLAAQAPVGEAARVVRPRLHRNAATAPPRQQPGRRPPASAHQSTTGVSGPAPTNAASNWLPLSWISTKPDPNAGPEAAGQRPYGADFPAIVLIILPAR